MSDGLPTKCLRCAVPFRYIKDPDREGAPPLCERCDRVYLVLTPHPLWRTGEASAPYWAAMTERVRRDDVRTALMAESRARTKAAREAA